MFVDIIFRSDKVSNRTFVKSLCISRGVFCCGQVLIILIFFISLMASKRMSGALRGTGRCAGRRSVPHRVTSYFSKNSVIRVDINVTNYSIKWSQSPGGPFRLFIELPALQFAMAQLSRVSTLKTCARISFVIGNNLFYKLVVPNL